MWRGPHWGRVSKGSRQLHVLQHEGEREGGKTRSRWSRRGCPRGARRTTERPWAVGRWLRGPGPGGFEGGAWGSWVSKPSTGPRGADSVCTPPFTRSVTF